MEYNITMIIFFFCQAKNIYLHEHQEEDVVTGLKQKTHYGRPNWETEFSNIAQTHPE